MTEKWILIVDDEGSILTVLKSSLKKLGDEYHVSTASSGYEALRQIVEHEYNLVITDYKMPEMDGLQLMEKIHALRPKTRVILMTAYGNASVEAQAARLKAYRYLSKPLEIETFRRVVQEAVGKSGGTGQGFLVLSDDDYREVNHVLQQLQGNLGARSVLLTDSEGKYIACAGVMNDLPIGKISSLLGGCLATLIEAGKSVDDDEEATNLAYREGKQDNLYVVNVGLQFLLIIIIQRGSMNSRLGTVWYAAQAAVETLRGKIASLKLAISGDLLDADLEQAVSNQLQQILCSPEQPGPVEKPAIKPLPQSETPGESEISDRQPKPIWPAPPTLLNFDEACAKGILPPEFGDKASQDSSEKGVPNGQP